MIVLTLLVLIISPLLEVRCKDTLSWRIEEGVTKSCNLAKQMLVLGLQLKSHPVSKGQLASFKIKFTSSSDPVVNEIGIYITTYDQNWGFHIFYRDAIVMTHTFEISEQIPTNKTIHFVATDNNLFAVVHKKRADNVEKSLFTTLNSHITDFQFLFLNNTASKDTLGLFYRIKPQQCGGLDGKWTNIRTDTEFPVSVGDVITLSCNDGHELHGNKEVTCVRDQTYEYHSEPWCKKIKPKCAGLSIEWRQRGLEINTVDTITEGDEISVHCRDGSKTLVGDKRVTCVSGTTYSYDVEPDCRDDGIEESSENSLRGVFLTSSNISLTNIKQHQTFDNCIDYRVNSCSFRIANMARPSLLFVDI